MRKDFISTALICAVLAIDVAALVAIQLDRHAPPAITQTESPMRYRLLADYPDGNEYVIDYNLTAEDCSATATTAAAKHPSVEFLCQATGAR